MSFTSSASSSAQRMFLVALGLFVLVVAEAGPAAATRDPPQRQGNCAHTNTSYVGVVIGVGNGKDKSGTITKHGEAVGLACLVRTKHHVTVSLQWDTIGLLHQGTFDAYVRDCTTKKWTLVTYLEYPHGTKKTGGKKTSTRSFTSRHKVQPVVQGSGSYARAPVPIQSGTAGHFGALNGFRAFGKCV